MKTMLDARFWILDFRLRGMTPKTFFRFFTKLSFFIPAKGGLFVLHPRRNGKDIPLFIPKRVYRPEEAMAVLILLFRQSQFSLTRTIHGF